MTGDLSPERRAANLAELQERSERNLPWDVVVIGGGMTAIDVAVQSKLLGAEEVTILYRRGQQHMKASLFEQELAQTRNETASRLADAERRAQAIIEEAKARATEEGNKIVAAARAEAEQLVPRCAIGQRSLNEPLTTPECLRTLHGHQHHLLQVHGLCLLSGQVQHASRQ